MRKFFIFLSIIFTFSCTRNWSYEKNGGAQSWGDLKEEFKFCKIGYNQSPIDIKSEFQNSEDLKFFYGNSEVEKRRENYAAQIFFDGDDFLLRGKKKYFVRRLHFHHPSEHLVGGKPHSLEMQIFHKSEDEQWLVLGIFLEIDQKYQGRENAEFGRIIELLRDQRKFEGQLNLSKIVKIRDKAFFYDGSFTTPPCKEGVKWYVMQTPIQISKEQMNQIIKLGIFTKSNARPTQAFHPEKY